MKTIYLTLVIFTTSCASHLIDTTLAPTPFEAKKGEFTVDLSADKIGESAEKTDETEGAIALNLGVGYSLSNKDYLRFNAQIDAFQTSRMVRYNFNLNYWRSLYKSEFQQHLIGLSIGNAIVKGIDGPQVTYTEIANAYGAKLQYAYQYKPSQRWVLHTGANVGYGIYPEIDEKPEATFGSVHLGAQFKVLDNFELIGDFSLNGIHNIYYDEFFTYPGFRIGGRFILNQ